MENDRPPISYILTVDDHPLFRSALRLAIARACPDAEVVEAGSLEQGRAALAQRGRPLLALLDLRLPDAEGFSGLIEVRELIGGAPVAMVSGDESPANINMALRLGAAGFIPKSTTLDMMVEAITDLVAGMIWAPEVGDDVADEQAERVASLTVAQQRVLIGLQKGLLNKQIAYESGISEATVKAHMTAIFRKLGVQSRTQAVLVARRLLGGDVEV